MGYDVGRMARDLVTILRDPMVRSILAVVAISTTVLLFLIGRRRKSLSYMVSDTRVLGVHEAVNPSRVEIRFDGVPVTDVHLVIITVNNTGNEPIRVADFERALRFGWAEPVRILAAEVVEVSPESLQPTIKAGASEIVLEPLLLNAGDWLRIKTLINQVGKLSVDARIAGIKRIRKTIGGTTGSSAKRLLFIGVGGAACLLLIIAGEALGLWAANGVVELNLARIMALGIGFFLVDEARINVLELRNYYREKKDGSR
jgi:hypothetical protein